MRHPKYEDREAGHQICVSYQRPLLGWKDESDSSVMYNFYLRLIYGSTGETTGRGKGLEIIISRTVVIGLLAALCGTKEASAQHAFQRLLWRNNSAATAHTVQQPHAKGKTPEGLDHETRNKDGPDVCSALCWQKNFKSQAKKRSW